MTATLALVLALAPSWIGAAELTIAEGVVVKFGQGAQLDVRDKLAAGHGVALTSDRDDSLGGALTEIGGTPAAGQWQGLRLEKSSAAYGAAAIDDLLVRYAGGGDQGASVVLRGVAPRLSGLRVEDGMVGLRLQQAASPTISASSFLRNQTGLEAVDGSQPVIGGSQFVGNAQAAVLNRTPASAINAKGNWWGHASGPKDPAANPGGQGDSVSAGVDYANFLAAAPLLSPSVRLTSPAAYFESHRIALALSCINAVEYRLAESEAFANVAFKPLSSGRGDVELDLSAGDGRKAVYAQFRDARGLVVTATLAGGALVDSEAPRVAITNPADGSLIRDPITIEAEASDQAGVKQVQFFQGAELLATRTAAPYRHDWQTDAVADGQYALKAVATDIAGRVSSHSVNVAVSHTAPVPDTEGPVLTELTVDGVALADGFRLNASSTLALRASDRSAISRIEILLDGTVAANATGNGSYSAALNLSALAAGTHVLAVRAFDSLGNQSQQQYTIELVHPAPSAPTIQQPTDGSVTRQTTVTVSGQALAGSDVLVRVDDVEAAQTAAGTDGRFSATVTLASGSHRLSAVARNTYGTSAPSATVTVQVDTSVPSAPSGLVANLVNGKVRLQWLASTDPKTTGHDVYRASADFEDISQAQRVARLGNTASQYEDSPQQDGRLIYRVVAINAAGVSSLPSSPASVMVDRGAPYAVAIQYQSRGGAYDSSRKLFGRGTVDVVVQVSEPLQGTPYLSLVPEGGLPIPIDLVKQDDTHYTGSFALTASAGAGTANVLFSARDAAGNRGDQVQSGATLAIDTRSPVVSAITLDPVAPIDAGHQRQVSVRFAFDEDLADGTAPTAQYRLSSTGRNAVPLTLQRQSARQWMASFELPADAGASAAETLSFEVVAADALGNSGSQIDALNRFQIYQGELPALDVPVGLRATAQSGGKVTLEWQAVDGATTYQVYRQAPGESERTALARSTTTGYLDSTPRDGRYRYAVASVRLHNGSEAASAQSAVAEADSSRTAPGAPQNLQLSLTSQGVLATWQPPIGTAPAAYRLYRAATSSIASVDGLTPIKQGIHQTQAVDAAPSQSEHAYVVTAVDAAGNESAISNSAYLNFSLLPVRTLEATQHGDALPLLRWTAAGSGAVGYYVYVGEGDARLKLTSTPIQALQWTDSGFTSGSRYYTVEAVDENGQRQARSLRLPKLTTQVVSGLPLKRNVMNRLGLQVSNLSSEALASAQVIVAVGTRRFVSERFVLAGNATQVVPVIVGGYPDIPASATLSLDVEDIPHEGELVRVGTDRQVNAVDSTLVVGLETERFVRGATGKVRLTVENTSDVQIELLTARNNGRSASSELRLKLLDNDGNLLASNAYQQATGVGVITLANGDTVARIAPGQRYVSDAFEMAVPSASPDQVKLRLDVDALRYNSGEENEVRIPGMGSERSLVLANTPYYGEIAAVTPAVSFGQQDLSVTGRALDRDSGQPVPNAPLRIAINQEGFERLADVTSDPQGAFRYVFKPTVTDSGTYQVGAIHPDMTDRPQQAQFTINRVNVSPASFKVSVPRNYAYRMEFRAATGLGAQASNVRIAYLPQYQSSGVPVAGIRVEPGAPLQIASRQNLALTASISGDNSAPASGRVFLAVLADGASEPLALIPVDFTLTEAVPALFATPNYVETGLAQGQGTIERLELENKGFVAMTGVTLALVNPDGSPAPSWVSLVSGQSLGTLEIGQKQSVDLNIAPTTAVAEGVHEFRVRVAGSNLPQQDVNVFVSVTQSGQGSVLLKAADIYTATRDKQGNLIPGLAGARIKLQNEAVISQTYEMATDAFGEAFFQNLPAGSYRYRASAPNHQEAAGRFVIKPGLTVNQPVFLEYTLITVEWDVREISIEDRYEITLNATFETDVPAPVVVIQPTSINLPKMMAGEVFQGELVVTNYGLVRADDVVAHLPGDDDHFKFEFLAQPPVSLEAKQRVRLPYRVIALRSYGGSAEAAASASISAVAADGAAATSGSEVTSGNGGTSQSAGSTGVGTASAAAATASAAGTATTSSTSGTSGCYTYSNQYRMTCKYTCANGTESTSCGSGANWFYVESSSCPVGGSPIGGGGGGGVGGGGWGGSGGPDYTGLPGVPICAKGSGDCYEPGNKQSGGGKEGGR
ncbi:carboxypeptidase regulatory-like domain-containing protein [Xanthomonas hyacinthi]|uniref:carboxypeptidase regulatory-like domain-containing protein n=1 Tax=Xanthomonas hyacinthi TaxID=56455 RepID=UPI0011B097E9|nr:carboxypeptidase regulatory-like domain-containing protein [Xanthomonas hyacinthi]QGY78887.1 carboxypeptidase regulatory-like domain-containing protein [Xanthomonas hyacinthi]